MATTIGVKLGIDGEAEYRKSLKNIQSQTKTLDSQLQSLQSTFDDETKSMEDTEKETDLLRKKSEKLEDQIDMLKDAVEKAAEMYGESSTECQSWEQALANAEKQLNETNSAISENEEEMEGMDSALGQLTSTISEQETELDNLREAYINAVLEYGEGSDEAQAYADQIVTLNGDLQANQAALDNATASADALTGAMDSASDSTDGVGDAAVAAAGAFSPAMASIITAASSGDLISSLTSLAGMVGEVATNALEIIDSFEEMSGSLAVATDLVGPELDALTEKAKNLWLAIKDENFEASDATDIMGMLATRLGLTQTDNEALTTAIAEFCVTTGVDGVTAVNGLVDVMKKWSMEGDTDEETATNLCTIMDMLMQAQADADVSVTTLMSSLTNQSGAFESLGLSMDEAIGFMTSYRDAGGQTSDITTGMYQAFKNLNDVTDDVPTAWQQVVDILQTSDTTSEALNTEVGNLGITIEDVFGARKAQTIADTFTSSDVAIEQFTSSVQNSEGTLVSMYDESRTLKDGIAQFGNQCDATWASLLDGSAFAKAQLGGDANYYVEKWRETSSWYQTYGEEICTEYIDFSDASSDTADDVDDANTAMADSAEKNMNAMVDTASTTMDNMSSDISTSLDGISTDFSTAQSDWVSTVGSTIYGPKIVAPTITYTKSGNNMIPSATYHTYARAYDNALLLNGASIFGMAGGSALVGGEKAGAEVVVGESHLQHMFEDAIVNVGYSGSANAIESLLREYLPALGNQSIYLDSGELVGATANKMNSALGRLSAKSARGM